MKLWKEWIVEIYANIIIIFREVGCILLRYNNK
jgi:hypothetical protein